MRLQRIITDYGREPRRWHLTQGSGRMVPLVVAWRHPIKTLRFLFTNWTSDDGL